MKKFILNINRDSDYFSPLYYYLKERIKNSRCPYLKRGFTLVEVMIAFSIFMIISGIVLTVIVAGFRSFSQGQNMAQREQRKRFVFFRLGKELSSLTRIVYPGNYFKGDENSFFLFSIRRIT